MRRVAIRILVLLTFSLGAFAQQAIHNHFLSLPVEDAFFDNCDTIAARAQRVEAKGASAYSVELYPKTRGDTAIPFHTEITAHAVSAWVAQERTPQPFAMFYSIDGRYLLKCRDTAGEIHEIAGASGNPLDLGDGASILHFSFYVNEMANALVTTSKNLAAVHGDEVLDRATKLLGARSVLLYIRNDPWFFAYTHDSTPYLFLDRSKAPSYPAYRSRQTIHCTTGSGCRLSASWP